MNLVTVAIAGGGAFLLYKAATAKAATPITGAGSQVPVNPAGEAGGDLGATPPGTTETGGSNGEPPEGCLGPACDQGDAGLAPEPEPSRPSSPSTGDTRPPLMAPRPGSTIESQAASGGAYDTTTTRQSYVDYKTSGFDPLYDGRA